MCFSGCGGAGFDSIKLIRMIEGVDFLRAVERLADILGLRFDSRSSSSWHSISRRNPPVVERVENRRPARDVAGLWSRLASRDNRGESYLAGRELLPSCLDSDTVRFNVGASGDAWLDSRAREGYRVAFAVRGPSGAVQSVSLRHVGPGDPPSYFGSKSKLTLEGCFVAGAAIVRPGIVQLLGRDSEFARDEIEIVEGGTDWLAAQLAADIKFVDCLRAPRWTLGAIGVLNGVKVVEAFAAMIRGRRFFIRFDSDDAGESETARVAAAAYRAGALEVLRVWPKSKDVAADWEAA